MINIRNNFNIHNINHHPHFGDSYFLNTGQPKGNATHAESPNPNNLNQFSNKYLETMIESYLRSQKDTEFSQRIKKLFQTQENKNHQVGPSDFGPARQVENENGLDLIKIDEGVGKGEVQSEMRKGQKRSQGVNLAGSSRIKLSRHL